MKDYWFRPNHWGWGFVPVSVKGYLMIIGLVLLIVFTGFVTGMYDKVTFWSLIFYFALLFAEIVLFSHFASKRVRKGRR